MEENQKEINIVDTDKLPLTVFSNDFINTMIINNKEWESITQFIYSNLLTEKYSTLSKIVSSSTNYPKTYIQMIHFICINQKVQEIYEYLDTDDGSELRDLLISSGSVNLFFINRDNFLGIKEEGDIEVLVRENNNWSTNILGLSLQIIKKKLYEEFIQKDLFDAYKFYIVVSNLIIQNKFILLKQYLEKKTMKEFTNGYENIIYDSLVFLNSQSNK